MANKDYARMIDLGKWLQRYLDPNIQNRQLLTLFQEGTRLIGVDEKISPDCEIALYLNQESFESPKTDKINVFLGYGKNVEKVLRELYKYSLPWGKALLEFEKDDFLFGFTGQLRASYAELKEIIKKQNGSYKSAKSLSGVNYLTPVFESITRKVEKKVEKEFQFRMSALQLSRVDDLPTPDAENRAGNATERLQDPETKEDFAFRDESENPTFSLVRNYRVIVARIFFDFLFLGGHEYFLFCEFCSKFTVIQRKGRKKYCSDICRVSYRNVELAKL